MGGTSEAFEWIVKRYRVRLLIRAFGRCREIVRYAFVRPQSARFFHIVSSERNAAHSVIRCLESVWSQDYPRDWIRHLFIDDASTDDTVPIVRAWLESHPDNSVEFVENSERVGALANHIHGYSAANPGEIVLELNGDDWLADGGVLRFLNKVYSDPVVWATYNTFRQTDGVVPIALGPSRRLVESGRIRSAPWCTSHLRSFRSELFHHVEPTAFIDPKTDELWSSTQDQAIFLPIVELAGTHSRHIWRTTYIYNLHDLNDEVVDPEGQAAAARGIRNLPPHRPLSALTTKPSTTETAP
jgi:glycosyltransferase involved in cell wall biosynthesis